MRKTVVGISLLSLWGIVALADPQPDTGAAPAGTAAAATAAPAGSLVGFLRQLNDEDIKRGGLQDSRAPVRYVSAYEDLDGDGTPEAVVYMLGPNWCGSGGCTALVLKQKDGAWTKVTEISMAGVPIRMLSDVSDGWHDIGMQVRDLRGDPVGNGYQAALRFDGKTYPRNASYAPRLRGKWAGKMLIASANDATPLYDTAATTPAQPAVSARPVLSSAAVAQARAATVPPSAAAMASLKAYMKTLDRHGPDKQLRYIAAFQDLDGDGAAEAIVYLISRNWCGSGGCTMFVLAQKGGSWTQVSRTTISRPPVYALSDVSNGWHSLGVWVQGGGIQPGYEAQLSFDGHAYPLNPSVPPAQRLEGTPVGQVLIASMDEAKPLYDDGDR